MMPATDPDATVLSTTARIATIFLAIAGVVAVPLAWWVLQPCQINVINYGLERVAAPKSPLVTSFSIVAFALPYALAILAVRSIGWVRALTLTSPMAIAIPLAIAGLGDSTPSIILLMLFIVGAAAASYCVGRELNWRSVPRPGLAIGSLIAMIAALTAVHLQIQLNFYNHFMLGHADIGHFTEELKNALAGRGLRSDSFDNTRFGWHFVPLMYVLVPGYWLWPSITYLMTLGPLVLHVAALPVYWFVRRRTDSFLIAWLAALAWLLLPSLSRLVYSNTYGFAWLYTSVPVLCLLLGAILLHRWRFCWFLVVVLLLSRETHTAVTLGVGAYIALFTVRRRTGIVLIAVSIAYGLLCAAVIIPYFATADRYERLDIFGELGGSVAQLAISPWTRPDIFFTRLARPQSLSFLLLLLATMCFLPLRGWRLALAAVPALLVHLLMANPDWLSIKFWHHAMVIPIFYFAALCTLRIPTKNRSATASVGDSEIRTPSASERASPPLSSGVGRDEDKRTESRNPHAFPGAQSRRNLGLALAILTAAAMSHYLFGFSPLSKSYELYSSDTFLQNPDPRLAFVNQLRSEIPRDRTILASERMAAHFTDYRRLYTGRRMRPADFIILDQSDRWDTSGLPARAAEFAANRDYSLHAQSGPIVVFSRKPDVPHAKSPGD